MYLCCPYCGTNGDDVTIYMMPKKKLGWIIKLRQDDMSGEGMVHGKMFS